VAVLHHVSLNILGVGISDCMAEIGDREIHTVWIPANNARLLPRLRPTGDTMIEGNRQKLGSTHEFVIRMAGRG